MSEPRITLDRTNLKRLAEVLAKVPDGWDTDPHFQGEAIAAALPAIKLGWKMAIDSLEEMAARSPELYGDHGWPAMEVPEA